MTDKKVQPPTRSRQHGKNHSYLLDGLKVPSVTGILNGGFPKPGLIKWAAEVTYLHAIDNWDELAELPPSQRLKRLERARFDTLSEAGERGRDVHRLVHRYLQGEDVAPPDELADKFDAGIAFERDWKVAEVFVEAPIFSTEYGYAGRPDLLARLADGLLWLLDWKTSAKGVFLDHVLQLAGYRYADFYIVEGDLNGNGDHTRHPMPKVDRTGIVHLTDEGYHLIPVEAGAEAYEIFGAVQTIYEFLETDRSDWIGEPLDPPITEGDTDD